MRRRARPRRSPGRGSQLRLLLGVVQRLSAEAWTVDELAEALGVTRRTIWRVLVAVRGARLPLVGGRDPHGPAWRYRLRPFWWEATEGTTTKRRAG